MSSDNTIPIFAAPDTNDVQGQLSGREITFDASEGLPTHDEMPSGIQYRPLEVEDQNGTEVVVRAEILGFALSPNQE